MLTAFEIAGYDDAVVEKEFGGMLNAFRYGAPPHGGIAPGLTALSCYWRNKRICAKWSPFPMNQQAEDLLMQAPGNVSNAQLRELHIRLNLPKEEGGKESD